MDTEEKRQMEELEKLAEMLFYMPRDSIVTPTRWHGAMLDLGEYI